MPVEGLYGGLIITSFPFSGLGKTSLAAVYKLAADPAARTVQLHWIGDLGYSVTAIFTFDPAYSTVIGTSTACTGLLELSVEVFDPGGTRIDESIDVRKGIPFYPFLEFSFDTAENGFTPGSFLDIGYDPGYWLQAHFSETVIFRLWGRTPEIDPDGYAALVDSGASYQLFLIPEPGAGALAWAFGIAWCLCSRKRHIC